MQALIKLRDKLTPQISSESKVMASLCTKKFCRRNAEIVQQLFRQRFCAGEPVNVIITLFCFQN